jgi:hypothetical protein
VEEAAMTDDTMRDALARLESELDALRREVAAARAPQARRQGAGRALPALALVLLLTLAPVGLLANDRFADVPADNPHHDDIALLAAAGITRSCNPPDNTEYCPGDAVTRQQMASFLARTAGLGANPPVARALTAQGVVSGSAPAGQVLTADGGGGSAFAALPIGTGGTPGPPGPPGPSGLNYARTIVVSPMGTAAQNGTALITALAGITGASATNPWLLKIEPGVYDLGGGKLVMKPYVDVEGSGEGVTTITAAGRAASEEGTVVGVAFAELRSLTVANTGGGQFANAIYVANINNLNTPFRITHVTARASATGGFVNTIYLNNGGVMRIADSTIVASGGAGAAGISIYNGSDAEMSKSSISVRDAGYNYGVVLAGDGNVSLEYSTIASGTYGIYSQGGANNFASVYAGRVRGDAKAIFGASNFTLVMTLSALSAQVSPVVSGDFEGNCIFTYSTYEGLYERDQSCR